jgi:hypothetical protein
MTGNREEGSEGGGRHYGPFVWTAYRAYNELLREKIRAKFESAEGPWMDELAGHLVELVNARWEGGRKGEKLEAQIREKIDRLLEQ